MSQEFQSVGDFMARMERVRKSAEQEIRDFWTNHPDGIDVEYDDGLVVHVSPKSTANDSKAV